MNTGRQGPRRNHHVIPRLYLKGFAEAPDSPFVWVYTMGRSFNPGEYPDRAGKHNPVRTPISKAAAVRDGYAYIRADGTLDTETYEKKLEELEKPSNRIFRKIRKNQEMLSADEKATFVSYITLMYRRVDRREARIKELWDELVMNSPILQALRSPELRSSLSEDQRRQVDDLVADYEKEPKREILLKSMVLGWANADLHLRKMSWRFLIAPEGMMFCTGDKPVFTSGLGLRKVAAELTFPISSKISLHASWQAGTEGFVQTGEKYVKQLNHRTAKRSQQLFFPSAESWLVKFLNKRNHPMYLIDVSGELRGLWKMRHVDIPDSVLT